MTPRDAFYSHLMIISTPSSDLFLAPDSDELRQNRWRVSVFGTHRAESSMKGRTHGYILTPTILNLAQKLRDLRKTAGESRRSPVLAYFTIDMMDLVEVPTRLQLQKSEKAEGDEGDVNWTAHADPDGVVNGVDPGHGQQWEFKDNALNRHVSPKSKELRISRRAAQARRFPSSHVYHLTTA
ncbi:hypothetical protein EDB85DRAFT_1893397 [Lactarius pseudohatsudake]|nr:hypothetical protein EDB85DRAFT_1893397 [Lactarius pseudohatsudake]